MSALDLVARIVLSGIFLGAAPRHFTSEGAAHAAELGVPLARFAVPLSGVLAIVGGLSVLLGLYTKWGAIALVAFLVPVTFGMHAFWRLDDPGEVHVQQAMFFKNLAITGGAMILALHGAGAWSIDAWLRR